MVYPFYDDWKSDYKWAFDQNIEKKILKYRNDESLKIWHLTSPLSPVLWASEGFFTQISRSKKTSHLYQFKTNLYATPIVSLPHLWAFHLYLDLLFSPHTFTPESGCNIYFRFCKRSTPNMDHSKGGIKISVSSGTYLWPRTKAQPFVHLKANGSIVRLAFSGSICRYRIFW